MPSNGESSGQGTEQDGLYSKYEVRKDGQHLTECFVLEPATDAAARDALRAYADATENGELASDLRQWVTQFQEGDDGE